MAERERTAESEATPLPTELVQLLADFRRGDQVALARAISLVENERRGFEALLEELSAGRRSPAARIGLTGPPGAGKSTLASRLAETLSHAESSVGVLAVDPTSPYSGGAFLGDRIRMHELTVDPGAFFRSMASRGSSGGLGVTTREVLDVMDSFGFEWLIVETVGVGQAETEVRSAVDTVVLVLVPESGDSIQALKAGLLEAADLLVVNKADRTGADEMAADLRTMLELRGSGGTPGTAGAGEGAWVPPVLLTDARSPDAGAALLEEIRRHHSNLEVSGGLGRRRRERVVENLRGLVDRALRREMQSLFDNTDLIEDAVDRIVAGRASPRIVARELLGRLGARSDTAGEV